jgi:hypothetical protein
VLAARLTRTYLRARSIVVLKTGATRHSTGMVGVVLDDGIDEEAP